MVNDQGHLLGFNGMRCHYSLGSHHRIIWKQVTMLVVSLVLVPPLDGDRKIQDWMLQKGNIVIPMSKITMRLVLQLASWFHEHANALWNTHKTQSWWTNRLTRLWSSDLPLNQWVFSNANAYWVESSKEIDSPSVHCA